MKLQEPKFEVLEEIQCKGYRKKVIKLENGTVVDMRIPDHTPEEEKEIAAKITRALFEMAFPDEDWSGKNLRIIQ